MPYVEKYKLIAESLIVDNLLKIAKDNLKPCLDVQNPTEAALLSSNPAFLADLAERTFGSFMRLGFPALVVDLMDGDDEDSEQRVDENIRVEMLLVVTDAEASNVTRRLAKYVRALRTILFTASPSQYFTGVSTAMPFTLKLSRKYLPIGKGVGETATLGYMRAAEFVLTLEFGER